MAHPSERKRWLCSIGLTRLLLLFLGFVLVAYMWGPPFFNTPSTSNASCPLCSCDCSSDSTFSLPLDFNSSIADCGKDDPEMNEEMEKDIITLLREEISLQKNVTADNLRHTKALITEAKKTSSHYQKEAEKCNTGMETCEEARERAEAELIEERKLSELWERRAHEYGWQDERRANS